MLILERLVSILSRHLRRFCISGDAWEMLLRSGAEDKMYFPLGDSFSLKHMKAISDLLKCKCLKKNANNFHWRIPLPSQAQTATDRILLLKLLLAGFVPRFRLRHVSNMQIFNEFTAIIRCGMLDAQKETRRAINDDFYLASSNRSREDGGRKKSFTTLQLPTRLAGW